MYKWLFSVLLKPASLFLMTNMSKRLKQQQVTKTKDNNESSKIIVYNKIQFNYNFGYIRVILNSLLFMTSKVLDSNQNIN